MDFLNYLSKYEKENVNGVKKIVKENKSKVDAILQEAFYGDFVSKNEAKLRISTEFTDVKKAPKSVDVKYVKENLGAIVNKVELLDEGSIKIIINNNEDGGKLKGRTGGCGCGMGASTIVPDIEFEEGCNKNKGRKKMKSSDYTTEYKKSIDEKDDDLSGIDKEKAKKDKRKLSKGKPPKDFKALDEKDDDLSGIDKEKAKKDKRKLSKGKPPKDFKALDEKKNTTDKTTLSYTEFWNKSEAKPDKEDKTGKKIVGESEEKEEWVVEYYPTDSDKMKIEKGFKSKEEADAWVKGENLKDTDELKVYKLNEVVDNEEEDESEDGDSDDIGIKWSEIEDHLASIDDKLDTLVTDNEEESEDNEEESEDDEEIEESEDDEEIEESEDDDLSGIDKEKAKKDKRKLSKGKPPKDFKALDEESNDVYEKIKDDDFGGYIYKLSYDFKSMGDLIELMKNNEEIKNLLYSIDTRDSVESKDGKYSFAGAEIFDFLPESKNYKEQSIISESSDYMNFLMGDE